MTSKTNDQNATSEMLKHWREAVPNDRLAHLVKDATRALLRALQMRLTAHSVSLGHWTFLRVLWVKDGLNQRELSARAGVMEPTTYVALKAMEKLGYVVRRHRTESRKNVYVYLTASGKALEAKLVPLAEECNRIAVTGVSETDVNVTRKTLLTILVNLARDEAEASDEMHRVPSTREIGRKLAAAQAVPHNSRKPAPARQTAKKKVAAQP